MWHILFSFIQVKVFKNKKTIQDMENMLAQQTLDTRIEALTEEIEELKETEVKFLREIRESEERFMKEIRMSEERILQAISNMSAERHPPHYQEPLALPLEDDES